MNYRHLTQDERYQIQALSGLGLAPAPIAKQLGRSQSTIRRELSRGQSGAAYDAALAQRLADQRALGSRNARRISQPDIKRVDAYLRQWLSPEQVAGRLLAECGQRISPESIYQHAYRNKAAGGDLVSYLRCQKARRKRYASGHDRRGQLKDRVCIEQRPHSVDAREQLGHWEGDTVIGHGHTGVLVTLVERKSRFTLVRRLPNKEAAPVSQAIIEMLRPHKADCLTLTFDNGKEFADHQFFGGCLQAAVYFAHPYHSWERGTNENTNGLIRQYFPKRMSFAQINDQEVDEVVYRLNHRPRKCLGFRTPHEVFYGLEMRPLH